MRYQLIATFFLVACQLTASTIDPSATSATASWTGPSVGSVEFLITGPSLSVQGEAGYHLPLFFATGAPLSQFCTGCDDFGLEETFGAPLVPGCGVAGIASGSCSGGGEVFTPIPSDIVMPSTPNPIFTFPAGLTASYQLCAPGPPMCPFPESPVAIITADLPGEMTLSFEGPFPPEIPPINSPPFEFDVLLSARFISTPIPESSTLLLTLIGSAVLALAAILRWRKPPHGRTFVSGQQAPWNL